MEKQLEKIAITVYNANGFVKEQPSSPDLAPVDCGSGAKVDFTIFGLYVFILAIICSFGYVIIEALKFGFPAI